MSLARRLIDDAWHIRPWYARILSMVVVGLVLAAYGVAVVIHAASGGLFEDVAKDEHTTSFF